MLQNSNNKRKETSDINIRPTKKQGTAQEDVRLNIPTLALMSVPVPPSKHFGRPKNVGASRDIIRLLSVKKTAGRPPKTSPNGAVEGPRFEFPSRLFPFLFPFLRFDSFNFNFNFNLNLIFLIL